MKRFAELSEQEVLALAISNEDEDSRIYRSFADALRQSYPDTATTAARRAWWPNMVLLDPGRRCIDLAQGFFDHAGPPAAPCTC